MQDPPEQSAILPGFGDAEVAQGRGPICRPEVKDGGPRMRAPTLQREAKLSWVVRMGLLSSGIVRRIQVLMPARAKMR